MVPSERVAALNSFFTPEAHTAEMIDGAMADATRQHVYETVKRTLDLIASLVLLPLLLPIMAVVAALIHCSSPGPALFVQKRLAKGGKIFNMYKFRTMRIDAEAQSGAVFASANDPRMTRLGSILRKFRLDELPQLFNVISGDMSFIGPRPERPEIAVELAKHLPAFYQRLRVKPGITGLAQVHVGYASCIREYRHKLALDIIYVRKRSLLLDFKIAVKTLLVIIAGDGAR